ncbi:hypothetical protein H1R20_g15317, partial [Candolleomyces eurysporus]
MEADIRKLSRLKEDEYSSDDVRKKKPKVSYVKKGIKYTQGRTTKKTDGGRAGGRGKRDESDFLTALDSLKDKLKRAMPIDEGRAQVEELIQSNKRSKLKS